MPTLPENLTDDMIRLLVWVVCDATMVDERKYHPTTTKRRVQFKLSRPEKIEKLQALLSRMQLPFTLKEATMSGVNKLQPYYIRIYGDTSRHIFDLLSDKKQFPEWFLALDRHQFLVVLDALTHSDGGWSWRKIAWRTTNASDARIMEELCKAYGMEFVAKVHNNASGFANGKPQHVCRVGFGEDGKKVRWKEGGEWQQSVFGLAA